LKTITVSTLGYGYIGKIHTIAYRSLPLCYIDFPYDLVLKNIVTRQKLDAKSNFYENIVNSINDMKKTDLADICTPNFVHREEIEKLIGTGINNIYCEKPLTGFYEDEKKITVLAQKQNIYNQVALVYRFLPAVIRGKKIIEEGVLGDIINFNSHLYHASYLDEMRPISWRLENAKSGGGALVDLGIHAIDTLRYVLGEVVSVMGYTKTVVKKRPCGGTMQDVDVDDFAHLDLTLKNNIFGSLEVSRVAAGATGELVLEIYGTKGSVFINSAQPDYPAVYSFSRKKWLSDEVFAFSDAEEDIRFLWPTDKFTMGSMTNMHMASIYSLLSIMQGKHFKFIQVPTFVDSMKAMKIIDNVYKNKVSG
jgi:predicted dehydrogenase